MLIIQYYTNDVLVFSRYLNKSVKKSTTKNLQHVTQFDKKVNLISEEDAAEEYGEKDFSYK